MFHQLLFLLINSHNFLVILIDGIETDALAISSILIAQLLIAPELLNLTLQLFRTTTLKQLTSLANLNQLRDTTNVRTQHRRAVHLGFHHGERAVLIPLRRVNGEPCLTDQLLQCLAFLEADVFDVLNTIYCLFQRTSTGEDELHIRQFFTDLDERADTLLLREAAEVKDVVLLFRFFPLHLVDKVVHCHGLSRKQRIAVHLALHELRAADHSVNVLVGTLPLPEFGFHHADGRLRRGTVDALAFHAVHEMAAEALLTVLMRVRIVQHVVRADQLVVMCREDDLTIPSGLLAPLNDFQNNGRCQLVVKIVQVTDIRLEVVQHFPQLHPCFLAVDSFDGVGQLAQFAATVEVHVTCVSIDTVAHAAAFVLHTEVLNLVSVLLQCLTQLKYVGF